MSRNLIIKFQDNLLLTADDLGGFSLCADYAKLSLSYSQMAGYLADSPKSKEANSWSVLKALLATISEETKSKPEYLFNSVAPNSPLVLLTDIVKPKADGFRRFKQPPRATPDQIPNLYNYFKISIPDSIAGKLVAKWLVELGAFLPRLGLEKVNPKAFGQRPLELTGGLLAAVYLTGDPEEAGYSTPTGGGGNQNYLVDMHIPVTNNQGENVGLTILEVNGWDTTHPQFDSAIFPVVFPTGQGWDQTPGSGQHRLTRLNQVGNLAKHGTKILGVLRAKHGDSDRTPNVDLCQGIVPGATIQLASCLSTLLLAQNGRTIRTKVYDHASALLQILNSSQRGDIVLLEVAPSGQEYPMDVEPAVYSLIALARLKEITVVAAAGNKGKYLPVDTGASSAAQQIARTMPLSLIDTVQPEQNQSFWAAYQALERILEQEKQVLGVNFAGYDSPEHFIASYQSCASAAILVGSTQQPRRQPASPNPTLTATRNNNSSQGPRVKVYAQGVSIMATAISGEYDITGETSGASAIIAGFVVALQSQAKQNHWLLQPDEMGQLLAEGITVANSYGGILPDYALAAAELSGWIASRAGHTS